MAARPMAATRISASRQIPGKSGVFEWQMVTVACSCISNSAMGLPTMSLRHQFGDGGPVLGDLLELILNRLATVAVRTVGIHRGESNFFDGHADQLIDQHWVC